jgi:hypothetical protein
MIVIISLPTDVVVSGPGLAQRFEMRASVADLVEGIEQRFSKPPGQVQLDGFAANCPEKSSDSRGRPLTEGTDVHPLLKRGRLMARPFPPATR